MSSLSLCHKGDNMIKPDRIARAVEQLEGCDPCCVHREAVITLLRREAVYQRARVQKIIRRLRHKGKQRTTYQANREARCAVISAYTLACDDLLAALKNGTP
jgi:hypothetical protein